MKFLSMPEMSFFLLLRLILREFSCDVVCNDGAKNRFESYPKYMECEFCYYRHEQLDPFERLPTEQ